jgi:AcrR family transcriptional regulator
MTIRADSSPRRRRRTPEAAQREIIEAAESLLRERPFRELTVDEVMRRTELSRPSFYVYFRDRHELVLRVVQHIFQNLLAPSNTWLQGDGGVTALHEALDGVIGVYADHAHVLRALADAAADDTSVAEAYHGLIDNFRDLVREKIDRCVELGEMEAMDGLQVATSLMWANERYLYFSFSPDTQVPRDKVHETMFIVWSRTLYGKVGS